MEITKGELKEFLEFFGELHRVEDLKLQKSLSELCDILYRFFLFGKPSTYILLDWEVDEALRMKSLLQRDYLYGRTTTNYCNLYPHFISFKRKKQLDLII